MQLLVCTKYGKKEEANFWNFDYMYVNSSFTLYHCHAAIIESGFGNYGKIFYNSFKVRKKEKYLIQLNQ